MFYLLLAFGICVPLVILTALLWFSRLLSEELPQEDITGINVEPTKRNLFKRLRLWLMSSPKKLGAPQFGRACGVDFERNDSDQQCRTCAQPPVADCLGCSASRRARQRSPPGILGKHVLRLDFDQRVSASAGASVRS